MTYIIKDILLMSYVFILANLNVYYVKKSLLVCHYSHSLTLHQKVDYNSVKAKCVCGCAGVVTRILSFDRAQHQSPISQNETLPI